MIEASADCCDERPLSIPECCIGNALKISHLFSCVVSQQKKTFVRCQWLYDSVFTVGGRKGICAATFPACQMGLNCTMCDTHKHMVWRWLLSLGNRNIWAIFQCGTVAPLSFSFFVRGRRTINLGNEWPVERFMPGTQSKSIINIHSVGWSVLNSNLTNSLQVSLGGGDKIVEKLPTQPLKLCSSKNLKKATNLPNLWATFNF